MCVNTKIPLSLLERIVELLDGLDASRYGYNFCCEYSNVLRELKVKLQKLELRKAYARFVSAEGEDDRLRARIAYLQQKRDIGNVDVDFY